MHGMVIAYSAAINGGLIKGEDGEHYVFELCEWHAAGETPRDGLLVRFTARRKQALQIILAPKEFISLSPTRRTASRG